MAVGKKTGGGTRKGVPNKSTADVKALASQYAPSAMAELGRLSVQAESEPARVAACKEILDRAYGKSPQAITGADGGPVQIQKIERVIVDPANRNPARLPPASGAGEI